MFVSVGVFLCTFFNSGGCGRGGDLNFSSVTVHAGCSGFKLSREGEDPASQTCPPASSPSPPSVCPVSCHPVSQTFADTLPVLCPMLKPVFITVYVFVFEAGFDTEPRQTNETPTHVSHCNQLAEKPRAWPVVCVWLLSQLTIARTHIHTLLWPSASSSPSQSDVSLASRLLLPTSSHPV